MARTVTTARGWIMASAVSLLIAMPGHALAQQIGKGRWASASDPVAQRLIEQERQWATLACAKNNIVADFIADDFVGTKTKGYLYTKSDLQQDHHASQPASEQEWGCKLISAKVRFYGADVAVIYGSESALIKGPDGKDQTRMLTWTDTLLRRAGRWQVIAVQDMVMPAK